MKRVLKTSILFGLLAMLMTSCSCYKKMRKDVDELKTTCAPSVLSLQGKQVNAEYTITFPANYFNNKAVVRMTPVLVFADGELAGAPMYLQGESVKDNYGVVPKAGKAVSQKLFFPYSEKMKQSTLELRLEVQCGKRPAGRSLLVPLTTLPLASGVSTIQEMTDLSGDPAMCADNFKRNTTISKDARILFLINKSDVRAAQLSSTEVKALEDFVRENSTDPKKTVGTIYAKSYASPDGPADFNNKLAQDRSRNTQTALTQKYRNNPLPGTSNFDTEALGEDWEGFRELVQTSDIPDKDLILQVLNMYNDPQKRDAEIKNLSAAFTVLKDKVLPELRRSKLSVNVDVAGLTDAELRAAVAGNISQLDVEELLFAGTLFNDASTQAKVYKTAADKYNDYRAWNNYGAVMLKDGRYAEAAAAFQKAATLNNSSNEVINNLGLSAIATGNYADAKKYLSSISTNESKYNLGLLNLVEGNYAEASRTLTGYNLAVSEILNGNLAKAKSLLASETNVDADYLKAVIAAREGDAAGVISNLTATFGKEPLYKQFAAQDVEFAKYKTNPSFAALVK
ncbi:MAG: tetratricopeptide repeat protein [Rikenellaceae bacterium]|nr:tetratricopeptide repeat protein [Rikenellaceae bacterium]